MAKAVKAVPEGLHAVTPQLVVRGGDRAIEFYKKAFGAEERARSLGPGGKVMHAEIKIGNSVVFLADEFPEMGNRSPQTLGGVASWLTLYVENCDALFDRAVAAGAKPIMPPADMFWGDRFGKLSDPFGHEWAIMQRKEDLTREEMDKRAQEFFANAPQPPGKS